MRMRTPGCVRGEAEFGEEATAGGVREPGAAVVQTGDPADDGEARARARTGPGDPAREHALPVREGYAVPVVADRDEPRRDTDLHRRTGRAAVPLRVLHQVPHRLRQQIRIPAHHHRLRRHRHALVIRQLLDRGLHQLVEPQRHQLHPLRPRLQPRPREQPGDQPAQPVHEPQRLVGRPVPLHHQPQRRQRRPQLVRGLGQELFLLPKPPQRGPHGPTGQQMPHGRRAAHQRRATEGQPAHQEVVVVLAARQLGADEDGRPDPVVVPDRRRRPPQPAALGGGGADLDRSLLVQDAVPELVQLVRVGQ